VENEARAKIGTQPVNLNELGAPRTPTNVDALLGRHIRALRIARGLSQTELGQRIGVSFQQVQKYERGANRVSASTLMLIASALGVPAAELLQLCEQTGEDAVLPHMAADQAERDLLRNFRRITARSQRQAVVELIAEMAKA
jgi:transcriptional regulator with XRE-family HTH domain